MHGRGLHKRCVHRGHGLAAILLVMALWCARHGVAALHRLLGRGRALAIECIHA
jgi:hypothetical protein